MAVPFWRSAYSEWLKGRRSLASGLVALGGLLVPAILFVLRLQQGRAARGGVAADEVFWEQLWNQAWESLAVLFLPLEVVVLTALVTHLEHRSNGWKQVRATPQGDLAIVGAKLLVVLARLAQLFALLLLGLWLAGVLPPLLVRALPRPAEPFPLVAFAARGAQFYVDLLPVVAVQFLLGLRSRNVLVPIGLGVAGWTTALVALGWRYNYVHPYAYLPMDFLAETGGGRVSRALPAPLPVLALTAFGVAVAAAGALFVRQEERG